MYTDYEFTALIITDLRQNSLIKTISLSGQG